MTIQTPTTNQSSQSGEIAQKSSSKLLILMGALWLILAAALLFYQLSIPAQVEITWTTSTEQNTAGFFIYRSQDADGEFELVNDGQMINSQGSPVSGAEYAFIDDDVQPGETYYYLLEEVELDNSRNRYENDMFTYEVPSVTWWVLLLTGVSVLMGLALLIIGLKEERNL